ncbi:BON domain-containing protein [Rhodobacter sp. ETT8]|uniref:BON domain-containing protein n=2 Tax=Pseudotabrizicola algicola TaxID=2709381 RepID=A0A6B3RNM5_9RHOB|nr:BON domain-containing protein [Pseudotabrizicola algicola]
MAHEYDNRSPADHRSQGGYGGRQGDDYAQSRMMDEGSGSGYRGRESAQSSHDEGGYGYGQRSSGPYGYSQPSFGPYDRGGYGGQGRSSGYGDQRQGGYSEERGFLEKAGDEISSWFGDNDAQRRRDNDHRGKGPKGYTRSDDRIREDVNDHLSDDSWLDASDIEVSVSGGEVTLTGQVDSRQSKRRAEDCVDRITGVTHVQNNLRVKSQSLSGSVDDMTSSSGSSAKGSVGQGKTQA